MCIFHRTKMKCVQFGCFILFSINVCIEYIYGEILQDNNSISSRIGNYIKDNDGPGFTSGDNKMHGGQEIFSSKTKSQQFSEIKLNQLRQTQIYRASHAFEAAGNMPRSDKQKDMEWYKNISEELRDDIILRARSVKSVLKFAKGKTLSKLTGSSEHIHELLSDDSLNSAEDDYTYYYYDDATNDRSKRKERIDSSDADILKEYEDKTAQNSPEYVDKEMDYTYDSSNNPIQDYLNDDFYDNVDDQPYADENDNRASLTEKKWRDLGTPEAVEKTRRRHLSAEDSVKAHITRVHYQAECRLPKPKIIQVTDASKRFVPHCTVLHRCEDDTGCCHSDTQTCYPKFTQKVNLHFYVIQVGVNEPQIETLLFENHTECQCVERNRLQQVGRTAKGLAVDRAHTCKCPNHFEIFEEDEEEDMLSTSTNTTKACRCDCVSDNRNCEQLKRGMEAFTVEDRRCISDRRCNSPTCEYGIYNRRTGRCPKMQEKFESARRFDNN